MESIFEMNAYFLFSFLFDGYIIEYPRFVLRGQSYW